MFEWMYHHQDLIIVKIGMWLMNKWGKLKFIVTMRGICWLFGCIEKRGRGWNMPEDSIEWWCPRCGANGINHIAFTRDLLSGKIPQIRNWFRYLPGRIKKKLCKHEEIRWNTHMTWDGERTYGWCKNCRKYMGRKDTNGTDS